MSSISTTRQGKQPTSTKIGKEISISQVDDENEQLKRQIDTAERNLELILSEIDEKRERQQNEISNLKKSIESFKRETGEALIKQEEQQNLELERVSRQYQDDIEHMRIDLSKTQANSSLVNKLHTDLTSIEQQMRQTDRQRKTEMENSRKIEENLADSRANIVKESQMRYAAITSVTESKSLGSEISGILFQMRDEKIAASAAARSIISDIEAGKKSHEILLKQLKEEKEQREAKYKQSIEALKRKNASEIQRLNGEINAEKEEIATLTSIKTDLVKRSSQQLSQVTDDIQRLKAALDEAERSEESFETNSRKDMAKIEDLRREVENLKSSISDLSIQESSLQSENSKISMHLRGKSHYSSIGQ